MNGLLIRCSGTIWRVLEENDENRQVLVVDCLKKTMPVWKNVEEWCDAKEIPEQELLEAEGITAESLGPQPHRRWRRHMKRDYRDLPLEELQRLQEKHRAQQEKYRKSYEERKARTHRLIVWGGLLESMVDGADRMTKEEMEELLAAALGSGK